MAKQSHRKKHEEPEVKPLLSNGVIYTFAAIGVFLAAIAVYSTYEHVVDAWELSALQGKYKYTSVWGKVDTIYDHLAESNYDELYESSEPQVDSHFPPIKQVFYDTASYKAIAAADPNYSLDASFKSSVPEFTFKRPDDIFNGKVYVYNDVSPNDINQGQLGDCYFLVVLSSLAETPARVTKIYNEIEPVKSGLYSLNLFVDGIPQKVWVDDYIATHYDSPVFAHNKQNELWVSLIEKAWAKYHITYNNTQGGLPSVAYRKITGFPGKYYWGSSSFSWDVVKTGELQNWPMWCGSVTQAGTQFGLVSGHAYSLLSGHTVTLADNSSVNLVRIRNPWGTGEWTGDWSDSSSKWTSAVKKQLGKDLSFKNDGAFYMDWADFTKYFQLLSFGYYLDNASYQYQRLTQEGDYYYKMILNKDQDVILTNTFTSDRLQRMYTANQTVPAFSMAVVKSDTKENVANNSSADFTNDLYIKNLAKGEYIVYVHFNFNRGKADLSKFRSVVGLWAQEVRFFLVKGPQAAETS